MKQDHKTLTFFYTSWLGYLIRFIAKRHWLSKLVGLYQDSRFSKSLIKKFITKNHINMHEYEIPSGGFQSFNSFFIRALKPDMRPIDSNPHVITSPADGKVVIMENLAPHIIFPIKNALFDLAHFVGSEALAKQYYGGTMIVVRLAPENYHWFHFPTDGIASKPRRIKGSLESVNPIAFSKNLNPLLTNERHLITMQTPNHNTILMIPVGAMFVGRIVETYIPEKQYKKGDRAGYFAFGGSTIALVFKASVIQPQESFIKNSLQNSETPIKMGQALTI